MEAKVVVICLLISLLSIQVESTLTVSWGSWSAASHCSVTCGTGVRTYTRLCKESLLFVVSHTVNSHYCHGNATQTRSCHLSSCSGQTSSQNGLHFSNHGSFSGSNYDTWGRWSSFGPCSHSCGFGVRTRTRACQSYAYYRVPCHDGADVDFVSCNEGPCTAIAPTTTAPTTLPSTTKSSTTTSTTTTTTTTTTARPVVTSAATVATVSWEPWEQWTGCSTTCGSGTRTRTRICPKTGTSCSPSNSDTDMVGCDAGTCDFAIWSAWTSWGVCSATCDQGIRMRRRKCVITGSGGQQCPGKDTDSMSCDSGKGCVVATWSGWFSKACSVTCGIGTADRLRHCSTGNDADCPGHAYDMVACMTTPCP